MPTKAASSLPTPFKGDSFPEYVLHRVSRKQPSAILQGSEPSDAYSVRTPTVTLPSTTNAAVPAVDTARTLRCQTPPSTTGRIASRPSLGLQARPSPSYRRPSLSEQLQTISQGAQAITTQLQGAYNLKSSTEATLAVSGRASTQQCLQADATAFQTTTMGLSVGKLECRFPCPVTFARDRCTYLFQHPFAAKEVHMIMYYRDMQQAVVTLADRSFRFRLARVLEQFGDDYSPANAQHWIRIVLATATDAHKLKRFLTELRVLDGRRSSHGTRRVAG